MDVDATGGVFGAPGSTKVLATQGIGASLVGVVCQVTITDRNNESVRQGTDIVVSSGGASLTAEDVEAVAGPTPPVVLGELTLGAIVTVSVRFGPEGQASVAATITFECRSTSTTPAPSPTVLPATGVQQARSSPVAVGDVSVAQPSFTG
jgi:hypothetical protein